MYTLSIDIETYSPVDLTKSGVYPYAEHPDFEILLFSYAFDDNPVTCIDLAQYENIPVEIINALTDNSVLKTAHNAQFERVCLSKYLFIELPVEQWECTMVKSAMLGLPMSLDAVSKVLNIEQGKMSVGKTLIRYFSIPCKPTKSNGERTRNLPKHDLDKWKLYKEYNIRDVEVERNIRKKIEFFQMPEREKKLYCLDQKINDIGVMLDLYFVDNAISIHNTHQGKIVDRATQLTSLDNPNSIVQLKEWLEKETDEEITSLSKSVIPDIIKNANSEKVKEILQIRQELSKTSVKKYQSMRECARTDNRVGGLLQFYGANRTGRWAGRLIQVQNLPQNHLPDLDLARSLVKDKDLESLELLFGNVPDTLSQLIRTAFVAKEGHTFMVADFSAIEARVIAWLAGEKWRLDVFATHGKIYEASASAMFNVPIEDVKKGSPLRQKGKIAELALGYQGGVGALQQMGALKMGLKEEELQPLVDAWRTANPHIVKLWGEVNRAALKAIKDKTVETISKGIKIHYSNNCMFITLPSGRKLSYVQPKISTNKFGGTSIQYMGMNQTTKQWGLQDTYGGKLVENIIQAIARDCLAEAMLRLNGAGYDIVMHVHDEVIIEIEKDKADLKTATDIMGEPISWAKGLLLRADGYITEYYKKD